MIPTLRRSRTARITALMFPGAFWMLAFFLAPLLIIAAISFLDNDNNFTLEGYQRAFDPLYVDVFIESVWISLFTTFIALIIAFPVALFMSRLSRNWRTLAIFAVMIPFWTNFLVRTYALQFLMRREGPVNALLQGIGLIEEPLQLLNTPLAVTIGLVYGNLPFMILPIYASLEKFDWRMIEAATDLGASAPRAFWRVMLPLTMPGVLAGSILTFVPAIGSYVTVELMGGGKTLMIGRVIAGQFEQAQNWTFGSALSLLLMIIVTVFAVIYFRVGRGERAAL